MRLLLIVVLCAPIIAFPQKRKSKKIELLHADMLEFDKRHRSKARRLIGNVAFKHETALMYCDSAYLYNNSKDMDAYGNVRVVPDGGTTIYGDSLHYNSKSKLAEVRGKVRMVDNESTLTTRHLDYNMENEMAYYFGGGFIENTSDSSTLESTFGRYFPKTKEFFFKDSVILIHPDYIIKSDTLRHNKNNGMTWFFGPTQITSGKDSIYCEWGWYNTKTKKANFQQNAFLASKKQWLEGDSIFYDKNAGIGECFGNVIVTDTTQDLVITGNYSINHDKDSISWVTGNAMLTQYYKDDTLYLHGDTLYAEYDSTRKNRQLYAYHKVKFFKNDMQGKCDSLIFSKSDSTIKMFDDPIIWSNENQMTGKYIEIETYDGKINSMLFQTNAFIISEESCIGCFGDSLKYNQIKGKNMFGYFLKNKLHRIDVKKHGQTLYYAKEDNGDIIGVNQADGENMAIYIENNEVQEIRFLTPTKASLNPLEQVPKKQTFLKGFSWRQKLRPLKKEDIFVWE